jgi:hypothetical protein
MQIPSCACLDSTAGQLFDAAPPLQPAPQAPGSPWLANACARRQRPAATARNLRGSRSAWGPWRPLPSHETFSGLTSVFSLQLASRDVCAARQEGSCDPRVFARRTPSGPRPTARPPAVVRATRDRTRSPCSRRGWAPGRRRRQLPRRLPAAGAGLARRRTRRRPRRSRRSTSSSPRPPKRTLRWRTAPSPRP